MTTATQKIPAGYKQTDIGVIPKDWECGPLKNYIDRFIVPMRDKPKHFGGEIPWCRIEDFEGIYLSQSKSGQCVTESTIRSMNLGVNPKGTVLVSCSTVTGVCAIVKRPLITNQTFIGLVPKPNIYNLFLYYLMTYAGPRMERDAAGTTIIYISRNKFENFIISLPRDISEQTAIATAISDADAFIEQIEKLIQKKINIKQGAMQQLLAGKRRLPGFNGKWGINTIEETTDCLDYLRVPLNENQRSKMQGDIPYCGANGVLDYVNNYVVDDDIILIAEDGGYFDEYAYRPIAYRMVGKCWVNNHAHILKAKSSFDQGFIYYSLVHKNILKFLASGTRAKLNKSEMYKIEIDIAPTKSEQSAIATVLSDMDLEIEKLESQLVKYQDLKQGMMQALLTGKIRLLSK